MSALSTTPPLIKGQRYLFYKKIPNHDIIFFRANFIDIIGNTLRISKRQYLSSSTYENSQFITMPIEWIIKIERLNETLVETIIPDDILLEIDNFF
jgi:hypothetical protein